INPYDTKSFVHFGGNLVDFWESTEGVGPELAQSSMGLLHTSHWNWLKPDKVLAMSKIRSDILHTCKIKNSKEYDNHIHQLHIAAPISSDDESSKELTISDLDYQVSDNESKSNIDEAITGPSNIEKIAPGSNTESGEQESQSENQDDKILLASDWDMNFGFGKRNKHLADDETAKWPPDLLFISSLEAPSFFESELTSLLK
ncbi:18007_t:CDS:2, partial [Dentiscutata erythropus]